MVSKQFCAVVLLAIVAVTHGIPTNTKKTDIVPMNSEAPREGRLLVVPALALLFKAWKVVSFLLSKTWFIIGLKLTALAVVAKAVVWAFQHCLSMVVGASLMFGFCKLTGLCSPAPLEIIAEPHYPYELLETAESYLKRGAKKFE